MKELMFVLLFIVGIIAVIVISVSIIRWVLRIDKIVELLQEISDKLPNRVKPDQIADRLKRANDDVYAHKTPSA
jgi:hypothetical protein